MKNKFITLSSLLFGLLLVSSCEKIPSNGGELVDITVDIAFKDEFNNDLLNPTSPNHYSLDSIHVYDIYNGEISQRDFGGDNPQGWSVFKIDSLRSYYFGIALDVDTTLLELNSHTTDMITCEISRESGNVIVHKVWYNGNLKWQNYGTPRLFTIDK
jgi:hypothetical protein